MKSTKVSDRSIQVVKTAHLRSRIPTIPWTTPVTSMTTPARAAVGVIAIGFGTFSAAKSISRRGKHFVYNNRPAGFPKLRFLASVGDEPVTMLGGIVVAIVSGKAPVAGAAILVVEVT